MRKYYFTNNGTITINIISKISDMFMKYHSIEDMYYKTKDDLSRAWDVNVYEVESKTRQLETTTLLTTLNIDHKSIIIFKTSDLDELVDNYGESDEVKAWASYYTKPNNEDAAAVFIINDFDIETKDEHFSDEEILEYRFLCKYISLLHEFGHVKDFFEQNNFKKKHGIRSVNLVLAEAFADNFALRYMKNSPDGFVKLARSMMAGAIINRRYDDEFYRQVYESTIKLFPISKLKKWANI